MKQYRNNGAIGALLDEYERAIIELVQDEKLNSIKECQRELSSMFNYNCPIYLLYDQKVAIK